MGGDLIKVDIGNKSVSVILTTHMCLGLEILVFLQIGHVFFIVFFKYTGFDSLINI